MAAKSKSYKYRVLEQGTDLLTPDGVEGPVSGGGGAVGGSVASSTPPKTKFKTVVGFLDHGTVMAASAHQARVEILKKLGADEKTLIVVREDNLLEDTVKKEIRYDIVSVAGQRRANGRKKTSDQTGDRAPTGEEPKS